MIPCYVTLTSHSCNDILDPLCSSQIKAMTLTIIQDSNIKLQFINVMNTLFSYYSHPNWLMCEYYGLSFYSFKVLGFKKSKVNRKTHIKICKDLKIFSLKYIYMFFFFKDLQNFINHNGAKCNIDWWFYLQCDPHP